MWPGIILEQNSTVSWANPVFSSSWLHANVFSGRLHNSRLSLPAHGQPSAVRSSRVRQRTAEAWHYAPKEMKGLFWMVANSSVSTHLTVVLIKGHNDESMIHHTSQWRLRSQMKHQLVATLCWFYFCRVTLHVSGARARHQEYLKLVQRPLVHVLSLQVSHHNSLLGPLHVHLCKWCGSIYYVFSYASVFL